MLSFVTRPLRQFFPTFASLVCWCGSLGALTFCILGLSAFAAPDYWFADNMSFFLRQFLVAGLLGCLARTLGLLMLHRLRLIYRTVWILAVVSFLSLVGLTAARTLENTARIETPAAGEKVIKVISINTERMFLGDKRLTAFMERQQPDILVIQEALWWLQERRWERLERPIGGLGENGYPDHVEVGASGSLVIYSNFPIRLENSTIVLGELHDTASVIHDPDRELLQVSLDTGARDLKLLAVHPDSPRSLVRWQNKRRYFDEADNVIQELQQSSGDPLVVIGDWNSAPWSARFQQTLSQNGLKTAYPGGWPRTTRFFFDYRLHWILGSPVDQFAVSEGVKVLNVSTGPDIGSDHLPLIVELELPSPGNN